MSVYKTEILGATTVQRQGRSVPTWPSQAKEKKWNDAKTFLTSTATPLKHPYDFDYIFWRMLYIVRTSRRRSKALSGEIPSLAQAALVNVLHSFCVNAHPPAYICVCVMWKCLAQLRAIEQVLRVGQKVKQLPVELGWGQKKLRPAKKCLPQKARREEKAILMCTKF